MSIPIQIETVVNASATSADNEPITDADCYRLIRLFVAISAAATMDVEASDDGGTTWYTLIGATKITASEAVTIAGPFRDARVSWSGNTGTVTVTAHKSDSREV